MEEKACVVTSASIKDKVEAHTRAVAKSHENNTFCMQEVDVPRHGRIKVTQHVYNLILKDQRERCPQRTPEWLEKRRGHITASQMAAVCNANPYETRSSALKKKVGVEKPFKGNVATEHGNKYEPVAIDLYEKRTKQKCLEFGLLESLNEGEDFLAGSPDGITASGLLIEVKCPLYRKPSHEIPSYYRYQIQFLMHILHLQECDFIQYVPATMFTEEVFIVTREKYNPYFWYENEPSLRSFWNEVCRIRKLQDNNIIQEERDDEEEDDGYDQNSRLPITINIDTNQKSKKTKRPAPKKECCIRIIEPRAALSPGGVVMAEMPAKPMSPPRKRPAQQPPNEEGGVSCSSGVGEAKCMIVL